VDFFEIIAFVVGLLYFLSRSNKKDKNKKRTAPRPANRPQQGRPQSQQPADKEQSLEDIFREIMRQQQPQPKVEVVQEKPAEPAVKEPAMPRVTPTVSEKPAKSNSSSKYHELHTEIDLKQAIIYDAILNRPDY